MGTESTDGLPKLVVRLDASLRDFLHGAALAARVVRIPLDAPPGSGLHVLEVHTSDGAPPLVLHATSAGPRAASGYPLRLGIPAPPPAHPHIGRSLAGGKLLIEAFVADGAAGLVYRARHRALRLDVAVKVLHDSYRDDKEFAQRFQAEALSASSLDHPNLTRVLDFGQEEDGLLYMVMEFLDGKSIRDLLSEERRLAPERALTFVIQVCSALTHAHARGVIHRDIKPENLVVVRTEDDDGLTKEIVKVCDFGIAHRAAHGAAETSGTPDYMAPELFLGKQADARTDVYACAVVLHECITGEVPIVGYDTEALAAKRDGRFVLPSAVVPGIDRRIDEIIAKALSGAPESRHASTRELRKALHALTDDDVPDSRIPAEPASSPAIPASSASAPPVASLSSRPEWLEVGRGYVESFASQAAPRSGVPSSPPSLRVPAGATAVLLRQIVDTVDPERFEALAPSFEATARGLAAQADTDALFQIHSALAMVAAERSERARPAARILHLFGDLTFLEPIAERALDGLAGRDRAAAKLLARAGTTGAYALYAMRLKRRVYEARERFVTALCEIGPNALPVINAGLERLAGRLAVSGAIEVAEDLLRAVPETDNKTTEELVLRYAAMEFVPLVVAATKALVSVRGSRARAALVALVTYPNDDVGLSALSALARLRAIDAAVAERLTAVVAGEVSARPKVRVAAAQALATPSAEGLAAARIGLTRALRANEGLTRESEELLLACAVSFIALGGDPAYIAERWKQSTGVLRTRLEGVMRRPPARR